MHRPAEVGAGGEHGAVVPVFKDCLVYAQRGFHSGSLRRSRDHAAHVLEGVEGGYVSCLSA